MKRKKKKIKKKKSIKSKNLKNKKTAKRQKKNIKRKSKIKRTIKRSRRKIKVRKNKIISLRSKRKKTPKTRMVVSGILVLSNKLKSILRFNFNLDKSLQSLFQGISNQLLNIKQVIQEERQKHKKIRLQEMQREKKEILRKARFEEENKIKFKEQELKDEIQFEKERKKDLQKFLRAEQAEVRKEQAEKQRRFLEQIKLEKKIEQFRKREALEIKNLEKYVLSQQRESYVEVEQRILNIKIKYQKLRDQKIAERVKALGVDINETDSREMLLQKEEAYYQDRQKIEFALESFYRSAHSLCFQLNKKYIPKYLNILRCVDLRMERGEIFIKWDDTPDEDWLILIYIKNNNPEEGIIIEDKTNEEKNISKEFKASEIFQASDMMVDALTKLLDRERNKRKAS